MYLIVPWPLSLLFGRKAHPMPTPQELFDDATGGDVVVVAAKKKLDDDTAADQKTLDDATSVDLVKHKALNDDVLQYGKVVVNGPEGHLILLAPNADRTGIITPPEIVRDGTKPSPAPAPAPAPTP